MQRPGKRHREMPASAPINGEAGDLDYRFPAWWFAFMKAASIPDTIIEGCLWTIIWPQAIADEFGGTEKTKVLGLLRSVSDSDPYDPWT